MRHRSLVIACCLALALPTAVAAPQDAAPDTSPSILGRWRISRARIAPWVRRSRLANVSRPWIGREVTFEAGRVVGPGVLRCGHAHYRTTRVPADGLFQSALRAPIADAAALGLVVLPAPSTSLRCDTGVFELHRADPSTMFLALDNVVYTLDRSTGALAPDTAPAGVVQRLLERHFSGSMAFDAARVASYSRWLTADLRKRMAAYLARKHDPDEAPPINGDPFTNSQEPPTRFSVALGTVRGDTAMVPVRFGFERSTSLVTYVLRRESGVWRVDDLRLQRRGSLRQLLAR